MLGGFLTRVNSAECELKSTRKAPVPLTGNAHAVAAENAVLSPPFTSEKLQLITATGYFDKSRATAPTHRQGRSDFLQKQKEPL